MHDIFLKIKKIKKWHNVHELNNSKKYRINYLEWKDTDISPFGSSSKISLKFQDILISDLLFLDFDQKLVYWI